MRLISKVCAQHLGWMFKKHWQVQGKRATGKVEAISQLEKHGIKVKDSCSIVDYEESINLPAATKNTINVQKIGYVLLDTNLFYQGLDQALLLTKSIKIDGLPKQIEKAIENNQLTSINHNNIKQAILESNNFESQQERTKIVKNAERKAFVSPRNYGITDYRRNQLIVSKLISECEKIAGRMVSLNRKIATNDISVVSFQKDGEVIQLNIIVDTVINSKHALEAVKGSYEGSIPDLYPMKHTISIPRKPIATCRNSFLHREDCLYSNPHTIFSHCAPAEATNTHGTHISHLQFQAKNLIKAFGVATSKAREMYGKMIQELPQPVVVQTIQTDGKTFHFGIFQLNTLDLNGIQGTKNYWFSTSNMDLYNLCGKATEKSVIDCYNKKILSIMSIFYCNS